jgi:hypothetical protein
MGPIRDSQTPSWLVPPCKIYLGGPPYLVILKTRAYEKKEKKIPIVSFFF